MEISLKDSYTSLTMTSKSRHSELLSGVRIHGYRIKYGMTKYKYVTRTLEKQHYFEHMSQN